MLFGLNFVRAILIVYLFMCDSVQLVLVSFTIILSCKFLIHLCFYSIEVLHFLAF